MGGWKAVDKAGQFVDHYADYASMAHQPEVVALQQLNFADFLHKMGHGMEKISHAATPIYKGARDAIYAGGAAWKEVDPKSYEKYGKPAGDTMWQAKEMGKSMGGWKAVDKAGQFVDHFADEFQAAPQQQPVQVMLI